MSIFTDVRNANAIVRFLGREFPQAYIVSNFSALYGYANITVYMEG